ncbi:MAG TPA: TIGR00730 family Rossman fold protein [Stellaceae bacterium]|nr:TIGR00730 family Rossman fold protein [Stellaceae bacterium]
MSINDNRFARFPNTAMKQPLPPTHRRKPLPEHRPKPGSEDADAPARIVAIVENPSYREADQDPDFLRRADMRGVRLGLDYEKPEQLLAEHDVAHCIVVFGSTRIPEPDAARRNRETLAAATAGRPDDPALAQRLAIAQRIEARSRYYEIAREFGRLVGICGDKAIGGRIMVMTGGGPGIMEAANRGAHDAGAQSIGLNIALPHEQFPNPYVSPGLCFSFHYFAMRKLHFLMRARALVAFPGGFGTLDELFEVLTLAQTRKIDPVPVILVGEEYWRHVFDTDFLVSEGTIDPEDRELFWYAETAADIWRDILLWYELRGTPLLPAGLAEEICGPAKPTSE